jgi:hypothetical protein
MQLHLKKMGDKNFYPSIIKQKNDCEYRFLIHLVLIMLGGKEL